MDARRECTRRPESGDQGAMRSLLQVGVLAVLALALMGGCDDEGASPHEHEDFDLDAWVDEEFPDVPGDFSDDAGEQLPDDAGPVAPANMADSGAEPPPRPTGVQRTEVPSELVGAWHTGAFDFALWENYREGYYAGRNAVPSREAMIFRKDGSAKFYRYEFAFNLYEELIDCEGTVAFPGDGTFVFFPVQGRKRFNDFRHSEQSADRALTAAELSAPKLAGRRAYAYASGSQPVTIQITVPSSAPYNWYRAEQQP
jgi:hypothetical protein